VVFDERKAYPERTCPPWLMAFKHDPYTPV